jgi:hypothetical protein
VRVELGATSRKRQHHFAGFLAGREFFSDQSPVISDRPVNIRPVFLPDP